MTNQWKITPRNRKLNQRKFEIFLKAYMTTNTCLITVLIAATMSNLTFAQSSPTIDRIYQTDAINLDLAATRLDDEMIFRHGAKRRHQSRVPARSFRHQRVGDNTPMTQEITITRPDDWHLHLRDGDALAAVVAHTAAQFARAIVMPNLKPPVTTAAQALAYKQRIMAALTKDASEGQKFEPLMTLYLTDNTPPDEIKRAKDAGVVALKLYPAGATTNSDAGVTDIRKTYKTLEAMQREGLLLLIHGEVTSSEIDLFDREAVFIDTQLIPLRKDFPELKIVFEHITTQEAAQYVQAADAYTAATITAHHLLYNRNAIFTGGIRPHYYCLPVLKRHQRQRQIFPGHRQRPPSCASQRTCQRLRRLLHRTLSPGAVRRSL
jgi:predicted TIM-barrel fold metal-dependent hydrolase